MGGVHSPPVFINIMSEKNNVTNNKPDSKVRVGIHSTKLMFGEVRKDGSFNYDGIDLSLSESKALFAIQKMLNKTNYEGNAPARISEAKQSSFNYSGILPRITFTPAQFLEAYGLEKRKSSRGYMEYSSAERTAALGALYNLSRRRFKIVYKRHRFDKSEVIDRIETESELFRIYNGYYGLTADEDKNLDNGNAVNVDNKLLIGVEVCPVIVDQIESYFILLDPHLHTITKGKSKYIDLFIKWLVVQDEMQRRSRTRGAEIKIGIKKLAGKLRMYYLIKQYKISKVKAILEECFAVGKGAGLIESAVIEDDIVKIALPIKSGTSTHKRRNLYPQKADPLPIKGGCEK